MVYIVIPAYNEGLKICEHIEEVKKHYSNIVVVNDGSKDNTLNEVSKLGGVHVLHHVMNRGQGASLRTGTEYSLENGAEIIVHFDADGQQDPKEIQNAVKLLESDKNLDIVLGSRFLESTVENIPAIRKTILKAGRWFTYFISGLSLTDAHNGFRAMNRNAASKIVITQDRMAHNSEIIDEISKKNLSWKEIPFTVRYTEYSLNKAKNNGHSSWSFISIGLSVLWNKLRRG